jgi:hypothetical protein
MTSKIDWAKPGVTVVFNRSGKICTIRDVVEGYDGATLIRLEGIDNSDKSVDGVEPGYPLVHFKPYIHPRLLYALNNPHDYIVDVKCFEWDFSARRLVK